MNNNQTINPPPTPFCFNKRKVKTFVLGADPSNFSDKGQRRQLTKVFGIGDGDQRYFSSILNNLKLIGLGLEDIYVQNMITEYLDEETSKYKKWEMKAKDFVKPRVQEFNKIDKSKRLPVLITAERIYKFLLNDELKPNSASSFYDCITDIPINPSANKLGRSLIPFYRHREYDLKKWEQYRNKIIKIFG